MIKVQNSRETVIQIRVSGIVKKYCCCDRVSDKR